MGILGKCPHCKENIYLGSGFSGPNYQTLDGKLFDPVIEECCPECGKSVKKGEWLDVEVFMLWD
jgi:hypothetical protein